MDNNTMTQFEQQTANALRLIGTNLGCLTTAVSRLERKEPDDNNMARIADALMEGVTFSTEAQHDDIGDGETLHSFVRLALEDMGLGFDVRAINDEPAECYGDATAEWRFQSPDELHALADALRTKYAFMLDMVASEWAKRIADGTIPAREAV